MMYEFAKRFTGAMLAFTVTLYLTACGGAANEESTAPPANKPTSSAIALSSSTEASSTPAEASSSVFSSSSKSQSSSSTNTISMPSSSLSSSSIYQRASRSSSSAANQNSSVSDTTPPSKVKLLSYKIGTTSLTFIWDHAVDDQGVFDYVLERDGKTIAELEYPTYIYEDKGLDPSTSYSYSLRARDYAGNLSELSSPTVARTLRANTPNSSSSSEAAVSSSSQSSSSSSNNQQTSSTSSSSSSNSSSSSSSTNARQSVHVKWQHPTQRANGTYLELQEIAGYEIRKKNNLTGEIIFIVVEGNAQTDFIMDDITANDVIDITVYDSNKLYSDFVRLYPQ